MYKIFPIGKNIVVSPIDSIEEVNENDVSKIIVPDDAKNSKNIGKIVKVGNEAKLAFGLLEEGDVVFYRPHTGVEIEVDGKKYLVVHMEMLLAVVKDIDD